MTYDAHTTNADHGLAVASRSCGSIPFGAVDDTTWHIGLPVIPPTVVMTDGKHRRRWPEEVASH